MRGYSGRGPTEACIMKPEVVAPGTAIVSCKRMGNGYEMKSGTSMATPVSYTHLDVYKRQVLTIISAIRTLQMQTTFSRRQVQPVSLYMNS